MKNLQLRQDPLWNKFLLRLQEAKQSVSGASCKSYVPFPIIFEKICRAFSIKKEEAWDCLYFLQKEGRIQIIKFHGIKINYKVKND